MIPHEIACLAEALSSQFDLDFDEAVDAAYRIVNDLRAEGISLRLDPDHAPE